MFEILIFSKKKLLNVINIIYKNLSEINQSYLYDCTYFRRNGLILIITIMENKYCSKYYIKKKKFPNKKRGVLKFLI